MIELYSEMWRKSWPERPSVPRHLCGVLTFLWLSVDNAVTDLGIESYEDMVKIMKVKALDENEC